MNNINDLINQAISILVLKDGTKKIKLLNGDKYIILNDGTIKKNN